MTPRRLLLLFAVIAIAASSFKVPLFFGVDFIFGSIIALIAASVFGPYWGAAVALIPAVHTYLIWNHPYAGIVLVAESFIIGLALRRSWMNLALAGLAYWILLGIPLVWLFYRFALKMSQPDALFAALKQGSNGVINAVIASMIATFVPWFRIRSARRGRQIGLFEVTFNSFIAAALIPAFTILIIDARHALMEVEREVRLELESITTTATLSVIRWRDEHMSSINLIARVLRRTGTDDHARMQTLLSEHVQTWTDFHGAFVTDARGSTVSFMPLMNARGESTLGLNFSDRNYFQRMRQGQREMDLSPVFMARGGVFEPVVNITSPIWRNDRFLGIVTGSLNLSDLKQFLNHIPTRTSYEATLIDESGKVIASTDPDLKPMDPHGKAISDEDLKGEKVIHLWSGKSGPALMSRWRDSSLLKSTPLKGPGNWTLLVELPFHSHHALLYGRYTRVLSLILILACVLLLTSYWVARSIVRPLTQLSQETTDIPERLRLRQSIFWPKSWLFEVHTLVQNFQTATESLQRRFEDLESSRTQLDQANRMKDEFLSIASHELNTPLTPLKIQVQMLRKALDRDSGSSITSGSLRKAVASMEKQISRLTRLISDLLDVGRINSGKLKLSLEKTDLVPLVREVVDRYTPQLNAAGCEIRLSLLSEADALIDPLRIEQVLVNLLTNAAKYASGRPVHVTLSEEPSRFVLSVKDQGIGIAEDAQERVFRRFERAVSETSVTGLGLGLFISRQIVEAHGGEISVESMAGVGSTFTVRLPTT